MTRRLGEEETREVTDLWGRLERLKYGIGGCVVTAATMPPSDARAAAADDKIRELIEDAIEVRDKIHALTWEAPAPSSPPDGIGLGSPPRVPLTDLPPLDDDPDGGELAGEAEWGRTVDAIIDRTRGRTA